MQAGIFKDCLSSELHFERVAVDELALQLSQDQNVVRALVQGVHFMYDMLARFHRIPHMKARLMYLCCTRQIVNS